MWSRLKSRLRTISPRWWWLVLIFLLAVTGCRPQGLQEGQVIGTIQHWQPLPNGAVWTDISLPHHWRGTSQADEAIVRERYRLEITPAMHAGIDRPAILIPRLTMNVRIYLDGRLIYGPGQVQAPLSRYWNRTHLIYLEGLLDGSDSQFLEIELFSYPGTGVLSPLIFGEQAALEPVNEWRQLVQADMNKLFFSLSLIVGIYALLIWTSRSQDSVYLYFGCASLLWSIYNLNLFLVDPPLNGRFWWWLVHSSIEWWMVAFIFYAHRLAEKQHPRIEQAVLAYGLAASAVYAVAPVEEFTRLVNLCHSLTILIVLVEAGYQLRCWRFGGKRECLTLAGGCLLMAAAGAHDTWLNSAQAMSQLEPENFSNWVRLFMIAPIAEPLLLTALLWQMTRRYTEASRTVEDLQHNLNARIAIVRAELDAEHQRLRAAELERTALDTRASIYQTLYEDLEDKLATLFFNATSRDQAEAARAALQDLQDATLTASRTGDSLANLITDIQLEAAKRTSDANIRLQFDLATPLPDLWLTELEVSSLRRVCREAVSNMMRHSGSPVIKVEVVTTSEQLIINIRDFGENCPADIRPGRGLSNMERRMREIGGLATYGRAIDGGFSLRISLPLRDRK